MKMMWLINGKLASLITIFIIYFTVEKTASEDTSSTNEYTSLGDLIVSDVKNEMQSDGKSSNFKYEITESTIKNMKNSLSNVSPFVMNSSSGLAEASSSSNVDSEVNSLSSLAEASSSSNVGSEVNSLSSLAEASGSSNIGSEVNSLSSLAEASGSSNVDSEVNYLSSLEEASSSGVGTQVNFSSSLVEAKNTSSNVILQLGNFTVISLSTQNASNATAIEDLAVINSNFTTQDHNISQNFSHEMQNISIAQLRANNTTDNDTKLLANTSNFEIGDISSLLQSILNDSLDVENTIEVNNSSGNTSSILTIVEISEKAMKTSVVIDEEDAIEFLIKQELGSLKCWVNSDHNMTIHKELNVENDTERHIKNYFLILTDGSYGNVDWRKLAKLGRAKKFMLNRYWSARIIPYYLRGLSKKFWRKQYPLMGVIGLRREFALSRNFNKLKYYWIKWRDITGKSMKRKFLTYIHENKYNIKSNEEKLFIEEENSLRIQIDKLYQQILPLYIRLHSYVRKRLLLKYGYRRIHRSGPIPVHLLGDISAHDWSNVENLLRPYPNKYALEICKNVKERNVSAEDIAKIAENFYISLGFDKMDKKFWDNSKFEAYSRNCTKPFSVKCDNDTSGIHACVDPDCYFFSMFHWGTFAQQLKHKATISPVISEAISKAVVLSVSKPGYLHSVGLSDIVIYDRYDEINFLMETALRVIPPIMDSLSVGLWKRKVMEGLIYHGNMNENFWKHRLYYQGLCPPVVRTERHFDAGAVKAISNDLNVMNEFLSGILQFQIYKSLCNSSAPGHVLHRCTLHNSTEAGKRIMKLLTLGKPVTIMDAISVLTDGEKEIEAQPMIEYFRPLYKWFLKQNKFDDIGWVSYDASVCPKCAF